MTKVFTKKFKREFTKFSPLLLAATLVLTSTLVYYYEKKLEMKSSYIAHLQSHLKDGKATYNRTY